MVELTSDEKAELKYIMDGSGAAPFTGMIYNNIRQRFPDYDEFDGPFSEETVMKEIKMALQVKLIAKEMTR